MQGTTLGYDESHTVKLADKLLLKDVGSDLFDVSLEVWLTLTNYISLYCIFYDLRSFYAREAGREFCQVTRRS